ncbi:MAG: hypothetical protein IIU58_05515, partial [Clostridia bacterium]|nr:hypothetical protein [Clostridia bacterium]
HYPYSEEMMNLADEYGFLVINEVPAVGMHWWDDYNFAPDKVNAETAVFPIGWSRNAEEAFVPTRNRMQVICAVLSQRWRIRYAACL